LDAPTRPPHVNQRRSQRILLSVSIVISGERAHGTAFSERTSTVIVNAHGALIRLREPVLVGQLLRVKNLLTNEEKPCKVADVNAGYAPIPEIGIAFSESCPHFWRVSFPPEDWSPHNAEAKRVQPKNESDPVPLKR